LSEIPSESASESPPIMLGMQLPDVDRWSSSVVVALGQNPSAFTGPGTNTYLVGTGPRRILLDTGDGRDEYLDILDRALDQSQSEGLEQIVLTHGHIDHIGGVEKVMKRFGEVPVRKLPWPETDTLYPFAIDALADGDRVGTTGATLRALFTPGHCIDHLCYILEEEGTMFTGDNILGVGTTIIPAEGGSLVDYMNSLDRIKQEAPSRIYPAHGPCIEDGPAKVQQYIDHRLERESQILAVLDGAAQGQKVIEIVRVVYAAYPETLYPAAGQSVTSHLQKLEAEGRVERLSADGTAALETGWRMRILS
jgi:ribonuclease/clavin/mitogillin